MKLENFLIYEQDGVVRKFLNLILILIDGFLVYKIKTIL